jgi:hypothetical protein
LCSALSQLVWPTPGTFTGCCSLFSLLIITVIDAVALYRTKSIFGFVINDLVGLLLLFAAYMLWKDLGSF